MTDAELAVEAVILRCLQDHNGFPDIGLMVTGTIGAARPFLRAELFEEVLEDLKSRRDASRYHGEEHTMYSSMVRIIEGLMREDQPDERI